MKVLEMIGFAVGVLAIVVALFLFMIGGPNYRPHRRPAGRQ
ncbi:hypothetical protein [Streptacidiphilus sp. P02-A3a]|nr:hypothetical protein [Streptacidiphilus sp. P02-A3a]QMU72061.1 NRT1/PTR family MFS transporter [Streptacidiphilus sp. P02-A3a]